MKISEANLASNYVPGSPSLSGLGLEDRKSGQINLNVSFEKASFLFKDKQFKKNNIGVYIRDIHMLK